ncbi:expansin family protein [Pseudohyphozyma bogoriensis]|nr:expansin family protein [Pseudohyphozyma bogoriensis]
MWPKSALLLAFAILETTAAGLHPHPHPRRQVAHPKRLDKVVRAASSLAVRDGEDKMRLMKRGQSFSGRATFFAPGLGACGEYSSASDYMVALNEDQYGDLGAVSSYCFKTITISYGGKSTQAQILDACPGW